MQREKEGETEETGWRRGRGKKCDHNSACVKLFQKSMFESFSYDSDVNWTCDTVWRKWTYIYNEIKKCCQAGCIVYIDAIADLVGAELLEEAPRKLRGNMILEKVPGKQWPQLTQIIWFCPDIRAFSDLDMHWFTKFQLFVKDIMDYIFVTQCYKPSRAHSSYRPQKTIFTEKPWSGSNIRPKGQKFTE